LRNLFIDRCRSQRVIVRAEREASRDGIGAPPEGPAVDVLDHLSADDLAEASRGLCARDRDLLERAYLRREPHKEIAAALGIKTVTVATRLLRTKRRLRSGLQRLFESRVALQAGDRERE
jgi:RNA polymerase sigma factor (sigma-70 family)